MTSQRIRRIDNINTIRAKLWWAHLGRYSELLDIILIAALPLVLFVFNPMISFGNDHACDAWFYFGFFHNLDQRELLRQGSYMLDRLPALLPGYLLVKYLPYMAANSILFLFHYFMVVYSLYYAARLTFGRPVAIVAAIFLGVNKQFLGYFSMTYPGVTALAFGFLAIALITKASYSGRSTSRYFLIFGGMSFAAATASHIKVLLYIFVVPLYYLHSVNLFSPRFWKQRELKDLILFFGLGFLLCTIALGAINFYCFGGRFNIYSAIIMDIPAIYSTVETHYNLPFSEWIVVRTGVHFGLIALICSCYYMFRKYFGQSRDPVSEKSAVYVTCYLYFAIAVLLYKLSGHEVIRYNKYIWLLAPAYMALLATVFAKVNVLSERKFWWVIVLGVVALGMATTYPREPAWIKYSLRLCGTAAIFILILIGIAMVVLADSKRFPKVGAIGALMLLLLVQAGLSPDEYGRDPFNHFSDRTWAMKRYIRVHEGLQFLRNLRLGQRPVFWISYNKWTDHFIYARSFEYCSYEGNFPRLENENYFKAGDIAVIVDSEGDIISRANITLAEYQLFLTHIASKRISRYNTEYQIVVTRVEPCP